MGGDVEVWKVLLGAAVTLAGSWLLYKGVVRTASAAKDGVQQTTQVDAQQSALDAWQELLQPYRDEVAVLRADLAAERTARAEQHETERKAREAQVTRLTERIDLLTLQLTEWKRLARVIARWATTLRDELIRQGGTVPATPEELLTLQAIDDADPTTMTRRPTP